MTQIDTEMLRRAVLEYLAPRMPLAFSAWQIARAIRARGLLDFPVSAEPVTQALALHQSLGHVEAVPDPLGATPYYRATAGGVLFAERGFPAAGAAEAGHGSASREG